LDRSLTVKTFAVFPKWKLPSEANRRGLVQVPQVFQVRWKERKASSEFLYIKTFCLGYKILPM